MTDAIKLKGLLPFLKSRIRGQDLALEKINDVVCIAEQELIPDYEPRGTFLFLGPTGTGKTETCLALAEYIFGDSTVTRFDMSEFANADTLPNFIGDHTGQLGRLGNALEKTPHGVMLFDEFEKAHPVIRDQFLQIIEKGRISVGQGRHFVMNRFYLAVTSNIGARSMMDAPYLNAISTEKNVREMLKKELRPEQIGRFKEILIYNRLSPEIQHTICEDLIKHELKRLAVCGYKIDYDHEIIPFLLRTGYDKDLGARPMKANTERQIRRAVSRYKLEGLIFPATLKVDSTGHFLYLEATKNINQQ